MQYSTVDVGSDEDEPERAPLVAVAARIADEAVAAYSQDLCRAMTGNLEQSATAQRMSALLRSWVDAIEGLYEQWQRARDIAALDE